MYIFIYFDFRVLALILSYFCSYLSICICTYVNLLLYRNIYINMLIYVHKDECKYIYTFFYFHMHIRRTLHGLSVHFIFINFPFNNSNTNVNNIQH